MKGAKMCNICGKLLDDFCDFWGSFYVMDILIEKLLIESRPWFSAVMRTSDLFLFSTSFTAALCYEFSHDHNY